LLRQAIPSKELAKVKVYYVKLLKVLESEQRDRSVERELLVVLDQACPMICG